MERQAAISSRVLVVISTVALALSLLLVSSVRAVDEPVSTVEYTVRNGDSLWSIAASQAEADDDIRAIMDDIRRLNDLGGAFLRAGQVLDVPTEG